MKNNFIVKTIFLFFAGLLFSCEALPFNYSTSQSWLISENAPEKTQITLALLDVQVDRTVVLDSVERETAVLVPLYFWNQGCRIVTAEETPEYTAKIQLREREFNLGWRTKRSLAVEVSIWDYENAPGSVLSYEQKLPMAVGRVVAMGENSFSSSGTLGRLLSKAIKKAVKELAAHERQKQDA